MSVGVQIGPECGAGCAHGCGAEAPVSAGPGPGGGVVAMAGKTIPTPGDSGETFRSSWSQFLEALGVKSGAGTGEGAAAGAIVLSSGTPAPSRALTFTPQAPGSTLRVWDKLEPEEIEPGEIEPGEAKGIQTGFSPRKKADEVGSKAPAHAHESRKRAALNAASVTAGIEPASGLRSEVVPVPAPEIAAPRAALAPERHGDTGETLATESRGAHPGGFFTATGDGEAMAKTVMSADDSAGFTSADQNGGGILNRKDFAIAPEVEHRFVSIEAAGKPGREEPGPHLNDVFPARQPAHAAVAGAAAANGVTATSTDPPMAGNAAPPAEHRSALRSGRAVEPLLVRGAGKPVRALTGGGAAGEREFSNIAAQDAGNPMLVRDPAASEGVGGRQEGWAGPAGAAGKEMNAGTGDDAFARLDAGGASRSIHWVQAGAHRAEAGYLDPALGWVAVRAESTGGGLHAAVLPGSPEAAQVLGTHLVGLNSFLVQQHGPHATATMAAPEDGRSGAGAQQGNGAGAGRDQDAERTKAVLDGGESDLSPRAAASRSGVVDRTIGSEGSAMRRAGTYVSVMA